MKNKLSLLSPIYKLLYNNTVLHNKALLSTIRFCIGFTSVLLNFCYLYILFYILLKVHNMIFKSNFLSFVTCYDSFYTLFYRTFAIYDRPSPHPVLIFIPPLVHKPVKMLFHSKESCSSCAFPHSVSPPQNVLTPSLSPCEGSAAPVILWGPVPSRPWSTRVWPLLWALGSSEPKSRGYSATCWPQGRIDWECFLAPLSICSFFYYNNYGSTKAC